MPDAKWYANWARMLPAESAAEKMRNLEAANLIESLSAELEHVTKERDAAVESMRGRCFACANARPHDKYPQFNTCQFLSSAVGGQGARECEHWQWRGVKEEHK